MQLDWLKTFVAVVEQEGFSAAANTLHRSQSRVSAHVAAIERHFAVRMIDRSCRPIRLTQEGESFMPHAYAILESLKRAEDELPSVSGEIRGTVALGSYPSASAAFLPRLLARFVRHHPDVTVKLVEQSPRQLDDSLERRDIDLSIRPLVPPPAIAAFEHFELWRERLKVVAARGHELTSTNGPVSLAELEKYPLITGGDGSLGESSAYEAERAFVRAGLDPQVVVRSSQPQTILAFAEAGLGVAVINELAVVTWQNADLCTLDLDDPEAVRDVAVFWNVRAYQSPAAKALLRAIEAEPVPERCIPSTQPQDRGDQSRLTRPVAGSELDSPSAWLSGPTGLASQRGSSTASRVHWTRT